MRQADRFTEQRGLPAMAAAMVLVIVLLIAQVWLLTATLESYLAGHRGIALPAALLSGLLFLACFALYLFVETLDAEVRRP